MIEQQKIINIEQGELPDKVKEFYTSNFRLVQIGCTLLEDKFEINYSFDKNYNFIHLRVCLPLNNPEIQSISSIYWSAFLYENEIHDLFGIKINGLAVDYQGNFYQISEKTPFCPKITNDKREETL